MLRRYSNNVKMKNKIKIQYIIIFFVLALNISCSNQSNKNSNCNENHTGETRYTFSRDTDVDFVVATGGYFILYDYSKPVDTVFNYCGVQSIGKDSLIYTRIRRYFPSEDELEDENYYYGECGGLYLYNGLKIKNIKLPYFDPYFSSFLVNGKDIYYWSFNKNYKLCVSKYNIITSKHLLKVTELEAGTDFFAYLWQPSISQKNITFKTESGEFYQYDLNLNFIKKKVNSYNIIESDTL